MKLMVDTQKTSGRTLKQRSEWSQNSLAAQRGVLTVLNGFGLKSKNLEELHLSNDPD